MHMKKALSLLIIIAALFALCACGALFSTEATTEATTTATTTEATTEATTDEPYPEPSPDEYFTFTLIDKKNYYVKAANENISGDIVIPKTYKASALLPKY